MATFLMAKPQYYAVKYIINPWMQHQIGKVQQTLAQQQWQFLFETIRKYAEVKLVDPLENLPDLVFTANAGLEKNKTVVLSHFSPEQRRKEEPVFADWFQKENYQVITLPNNIFFEGAGDALFQPQQDILWMGHGFRSQLIASEFLSKIFQINVIPLKLINNYFYHLDTCFCPLMNGYVMYYPAAFDENSQQIIKKNIQPDKCIIVDDTDAKQFACNAVTIEDKKIIVMNAASESLQQRLTTIGYQVIITPTSEYIRAGGATKCMTLQIA